VGLFGILLALGLLIWLAYRGWSILLLAPAAAVLAAGLAGEPSIQNAIPMPNVLMTIPSLHGIGWFMVGCVFLDDFRSLGTARDGSQFGSVR